MEIVILLLKEILLLVTVYEPQGATDNSQFFKNPSFKKQSNSIKANKLCVNLRSGNTVFNQIAIAYVDGATDYNEGAFYDTKKTGGYSYRSYIVFNVNALSAN